MNGLKFLQILYIAFSAEFLKTLYQEKLIQFDRETREWNWDLQIIDNKQTTDNIVELMINKIQKLPEPTQAALKLGACVATVALFYPPEENFSEMSLWL